MIKTLTNLFKQDKEKFVVPKGVQDVIPIKAIYARRSRQGHKPSGSLGATCPVRPSPAW